MDFQLEQAMKILGRTPSVLNALLRDLPDALIMQNEGADSWSPFDVIGHLIHGEEADWIPRAQIILQHGEARAFDPFDRYAQFAKSQGKSLHELLERFEELRGKNLEVLDGWQLTPEQLTKRGTHPDLGAVTLGQLLGTWVVHDLSHIAQITRVVCKQYESMVGPWRAYLPILSK